MDTPLKSSKAYWCVAEGCSSDDRKRGKYGYMSDVEFFPFPTEKKSPKIRKRWMDFVRREDYEPKRSHRLCSKHFVEGRPTKEHPYPELFSYNNYKECRNARSSTSIQKMDKLRCQTTCDNTCNSFIGEYDFPDVHHDIVEAPPIYMEVEVDVARSECSSSTSVVNPVTSECFYHAYFYNPDIGVPEINDASTQTNLTMKDMDEMKSKLKNHQTVLDDQSGSLLRDLFVKKILRDDKSVRNYTGIPKKSQLTGLYDVLNEAEPKIKYWSGKTSVDPVNYHQDNKQKTGPNRKLSRYEEFLITLLKLRLAVVSFFFG